MTGISPVREEASTSGPKKTGKFMVWSALEWAIRDLNIFPILFMLHVNAILREVIGYIISLITSILEKS